LLRDVIRAIDSQEKTKETKEKINEAIQILKRESQRQGSG